MEKINAVIVAACGDEGMNMRWSLGRQAEVLGKKYDAPIIVNGEHIPISPKFLSDCIPIPSDCAAPYERFTRVCKNIATTLKWQQVIVLFPASSQKNKEFLTSLLPVQAEEDTSFYNFI